MLLEMITDEERPLRCSRVSPILQLQPRVLQLGVGHAPRGRPTDGPKSPCISFDRPANLAGQKLCGGWVLASPFDSPASTSSRLEL